MQRIALLESERHAARSGTGPAASLSLHLLMLGFAIAATSHSRTVATHDNAVFIPLPTWTQPTPHAPSRLSPAVRTSSPPRAPAVTVPYPTIVPSTITVPASPPVPVITGTTTISGVTPKPGTDTSAARMSGDAPFADYDVDVPAAVLPGQRGPVYPEGLRALGIGGRVVARFVIGTDGRVEGEPTVLSATNDEFVAAVTAD